MKILIVDDEEISLQFLQRALAPAGHEIQLARNGREAMEMLQQGSYRMVISDWCMPGMNGETLCQQIREARLSYYVYIILLTSWKLKTDVVAGLVAGADDIMWKPFNPIELLVRIRNAERILNLEEVEAANRELCETRTVLQKQNKRLQKLNAMAQTFVDNVSHEFRTPLTVIKEYAALISEGAIGEVTPDQHAFLQVIENRADDLNTMVNDMLDGSRLDSGMVSVIRRNTCINNIVQRVRPMLERKAASKGLNLRFKLSEMLPQVYVDEEKIGRVLINLAINAVKFCSEPGDICVWTEPNARGGVIAGVTDNGPGIPADRQKDIFRRFTQVGTNNGEAAKGFGLGLSIAKELVELNLGELSVDSQPGCGTTFHFTLPSAEPVDVLEKYLDRVVALPGKGRTVSLITASIPIEETSSADAVEEFLSHLLRCNDLMFRTDAHCWLLLSPISNIEGVKMLDRLQSSLRDANRNRPNDPFPDVKFNRGGATMVATKRESIKEQFIRSFNFTKEPIAST